MKVGIIAPIPDLDLVRGRPFHLCLSHLCDEPEYRRFYRKEADAGAFITLDNSAHENGAGQDIIELLEKAKQIKASEIVLPDELFENEGTVSRTRRALDKLALVGGTDLRLMVVPQGSVDDPESYHQCRLSLLHLVLAYPDVFGKGLTIGFSKDYEVYPGGMVDLIRRSTEVRWPRNNSKILRQRQLHLLGWGRQLKALGDIVARFGSDIRSTDSAKPIMFALAGIDLTEGLDISYPGRVADYFHRSLDAEERKLAVKNIGVFERLAREGTRDAIVR